MSIGSSLKSVGLERPQSKLIIHRGIQERLDVTAVNRSIGQGEFFWINSNSEDCFAPMLDGQINTLGHSDPI